MVLARKGCIRGRRSYVVEADVLAGSQGRTVSRGDLGFDLAEPKSTKYVGQHVVHDGKVQGALILVLLTARTEPPGVWGYVAVDSSLAVR